ncbi:MAG: transglutaminase domain-containing protein, partial [Burkholderiales bacterium]
MKIAHGCGPLDDLCRMGKIRGWVQSTLRYERDPRGGDLLHDPVELIHSVQCEGSAAGDCDDGAILTASLLESLGIRTRITAVSTREDRKLHHVAAEARDRAGRWYWLDSFSRR